MAIPKLSGGVLFHFKFNGGVWKNEDGTEKFLLFIPLKGKPAVLLYSMIQMGLVIKEKDPFCFKTTSPVLQLVMIRELNNRPRIHHTLFLELLYEGGNNLSIYPIDRESGFFLDVQGQFLSLNKAVEWSHFTKEWLFNAMAIPLPVLQKIVEVKKPKEKRRKLRL